MRGGGGLLICCLALVIRPLTTHPFRDGAPFLLLIETPPTLGRSLRFFHKSHYNFFIMRGRGGCTQFVHGRSRTGIDPCIPTICREGARWVFTNQADITCTKREAP